VIRSRVQIPFWLLADVVFGSPESNFSAALVNGHLVCPRQLGFLTWLCLLDCLFIIVCLHWSWKASMGSGQLSIQYSLLLIHYAKQCHVGKTHSSITKKQAVLQSTSGEKVQFSSPESMMEGLFFFRGWGVFWLYLFTATELSSFVASFETTGYLETYTFLRWLWICCCAVFVCLCFTRIGKIRRCWRKIIQIFVKMDTESRKLPLK